MAILLGLFPKLPIPEQGTVIAVAVMGRFIIYWSDRKSRKAHPDADKSALFFRVIFPLYERSPKERNFLTVSVDKIAALYYSRKACSEGRSFDRNDRLDKARTEMSVTYPAFL